jgi:uncharacterized protein DUF29
MAKRSRASSAPFATDETAWLESTAELIREGRHDELDFPKLGDYLAEMAQRDRREVQGRLVLLLTSLLEWNYLSEKHTKSWRKAITSERQELADTLRRGVLRKHAKTVLADAYLDAVKLVAAETGAPAEKLPRKCPYTLDKLLSPEILAE